jgi:hypothetical protein
VEPQITPPPKRIQVNFYEVNESLLSELQTQASSSQGRILVFAEANVLNTLIDESTGSLSLPGGTSSGFSEESPLTQSFPLNISDEEHGVEYVILPNRFNPQSNTVELSVNFRASLPANAELGRSNLLTLIEEDISIKKGGALVILESLPTVGPIGEVEADLLSSTPLNVLSSPEFQNGLSSFLISVVVL